MIAGPMRLAVTCLVSSLVVSGCTGFEHYSENQSDVVGKNRIGFNRIAFNRIAFNRIAFNRIAFNRIAFNRLAVNLDALGDMLDTPQGVEIFSIVVECALPEGEILEAPDPEGGTLEFLGGFGLAPGWVDRPMSREDRRWVSSCLLTRVNAHNLSINVSLRGAHPALALEPGEAEAYTLDEGAFYGDVFDSVGGPLRAYACRGEGQRLGEIGTLEFRDCTEPLDPDTYGFTQCYMTWSGDCANTAETACKKLSNGAYDSCKAAPHKSLFNDTSITVVEEYDDPATAGVETEESTYSTSYESDTYHEIITAYVRP